MHPGEYILSDEPIELNGQRDTTRVVVRNSGDRPIQVGSHYHFFEVNRALDFDRKAAYGMRLDIPSGTAMRFEPGEEKETPLVAFTGARRVYGHNGLVNGNLTLLAELKP
jgi:urease subunit beta